MLLSVAGIPLSYSIDIHLTQSPVSPTWLSANGTRVGFQLRLPVTWTSENSSHMVDVFLPTKLAVDAVLGADWLSILPANVFDAMRYDSMYIYTLNFPILRR